uniref:Uncharacterized protein n=1 Tax=Ananas comosus var. bracteatus TaxID=296719 RepID=A0A6V7PEF9_ANACO|nr:unnamed protein product [Ananas comosus var. bracteatus]
MRNCAILDEMVQNWAQWRKIGRNGAILDELVQFWAKFAPFLLLLLFSLRFACQWRTWAGSTTSNPARSVSGCPSRWSPRTTTAQLPRASRTSASCSASIGSTSHCYAPPRSRSRTTAPGRYSMTCRRHRSRSMPTLYRP